jgi:hypothetical protein
MTNPQVEPATALPLWRWTAPAAAITAVSIWLIWSARGLPTICPAIFPAPPSCGAVARLDPAVLGSSVLLVLFTTLLVTGAIIRPRHRDRTLRTLLIVIVIAAVVAPLWTLGASGFALG